MMKRVRKKIAGLRDADGQTLAEFWDEFPEFNRWWLAVMLPVTLAGPVWVIFRVVMDVRENGWW